MESLCWICLKEGEIDQGLSVVWLLFENRAILLYCWLIFLLQLMQDCALDKDRDT